MSLKITGKLPSGKYLERLKKSPQFKGRGFQNLSDTPMKAEDASYWKMTREFFKKTPNAAPPCPVPSIKTNLQEMTGTQPQLVWFGHSSYFIRIENRNILVDPVFSGNAAPVSFMVKAFRGTDIYKPEDMPELDYLLLTHDHYDHLDYKTLRKLKNKIKKIYCSLGIGSHLKYWGFDSTIITEMDWWDSEKADELITLTAVPARHFSGRGLKRFQTLWSSFILKTPSCNIYIGGDSGYDIHFKQIGEKMGPFDLAILEAGQYNTMWPLIHMMPEETVQAAKDLGAKKLLPVHWGKFTLAMHAWDEPIKRVVAAAKNLSISLITPRIGEPVILGQNFTNTNWWELLQVS